MPPDELPTDPRDERPPPRRWATDAGAEKETAELRLSGPSSMPGGQITATLHVNHEGVIDDASEDVTAMFGIGELPGRRFAALVDEDDQESVDRLLRLVLEMRREGHTEFSIQHSERGLLQFIGDAWPTNTPQGPGVLFEIHDVTEKTEARQRVEAMLPFTRSLTRDSHEVVMLVGPEVGEHLISGSTDTVLGIPPEQCTLLRLRSAIHPEDQMPTMLAFERVKERTGEVAQVKFRFDDGTGAYRHIRAAVSNRTHDPELRGVVYMLRDVTEGTIRDPVTGLPNRVMLLDRIEQLIVARPKRMYALLVIGIDRLAFVRGTLGAGAADTMVKLFGERLMGVARAGWTVARTGEAELALLATGLETTADVRPLVERIGKLSEEPFRLGKQELVSSFTIGIAISTRRYLVALTMLHDAQTAYERAREKAVTGGRLVANSQVLNQNADRIQIETELYRALSEGELRLNYQPIVGLTDGRLTGFEALVRWKHPDHGLRGPDRFLSVAEESGQIIAMGAWIVDRACAQLSRWDRNVAGAEDLTMAVNVSVRQLSDNALVDAIETALLTHRVPPERLKIEVTESALIRNPDRAAETLRRVRQLGVRISLDDFGTGYCSLAYLTRFPVDALKIDREFISGPEGLLATERGTPLVRAILDLAKSLGLSVIAEGIETEEQAGALQRMGCPLGQGFYFGRPVGPRQARDLISKGR